jgi:hypothetical protein
MRGARWAGTSCWHQALRSPHPPPRPPSSLCLPCFLLWQVCDIPPVELDDWEIVIKADGSVDRRRYNAPTAGEVAAAMPGVWMGGTRTDRGGGRGGYRGFEVRHATLRTQPASHGRCSAVSQPPFRAGIEGEGPAERSIHVRARNPADAADDGLVRISELHPAYDPLHFVLLHPRGEPGWQPNIMGAPPTHRGNRGGGAAAMVDIEANRGAANGNTKPITPLQYYAYFMHDREPQVGKPLKREGGSTWVEMQPPQVNPHHSHPPTLSNSLPLHSIPRATPFSSTASACTKSGWWTATPRSRLNA